jgi:hypothetical protein
MQLWLWILGIPAVLLLFLPYTSGISPLAAVSGFEGYAVAMLGWPFFLAAVICIAQGRLFMKKSFSGKERIIYQLFAYATLTCGLVLMTLMTWTEGFTKEAVGLDLIFGVPCVIAVFLIIFAMRLGREEAALIALKAAWLPNAILCGINFWPRSLFSGWEIGAYLAAFTIVLYSVEIALCLIPDTHATQ